MPIPIPHFASPFPPSRTPGPVPPDGTDRSARLDPSSALASLYDPGPSFFSLSLSFSLEICPALARFSPPAPPSHLFFPHIFPSPNLPIFRPYSSDMSTRKRKQDVEEEEDFQELPSDEEEEEE